MNEVFEFSLERAVQMRERRRREHIYDAAYEAACEVHICIGVLRETKDPHRYRELHKRLSETLWPRYRTIQSWRFENA